MTRPEIHRSVSSEGLRAHQALLHALAQKYLWWKEPDDALQFPWRVITQVLEKGTLPDAVELEEKVGASLLRTALSLAGPGELSPRSWHFWHHRLGLAENGRVPPLPVKALQS